MIRISAIVASYNGEKYIIEQINSLIKCLDYNDEIIICDDASTDNTLKKISIIKDPRVKVFSFRQNTGFQKNFERAINKASGKFIMFCDQDDICNPLRLSVSLKAVENYSVIAGDVEVVDDELNTIYPSYFKKFNFKKFNFFRIFLRPRIIGATIFCKRDFLLQMLPFSNLISHDHQITCLASMANELYVSDEIFIKFRRHQNTTSTTALKPKRNYLLIFINRLRILRMILYKIYFFKKHN